MKEKAKVMQISKAIKGLEVCVCVCVCVCYIFVREMIT
jgi:hypothetical protein